MRTQRSYSLRFVATPPTAQFDAPPSWPGLFIKIYNAHKGVLYTTVKYAIPVYLVMKTTGYTWLAPVFP